MRQVRVREIVHGALQDCLGQPFCLRDVQGAGALEGQVKTTRPRSEPSTSAELTGENNSGVEVTNEGVTSGDLAESLAGGEGEGSAG